VRSKPDTDDDAERDDRRSEFERDDDAEPDGRVHVVGSGSVHQA
jgi:hypothetical protein